MFKQVGRIIAADIYRFFHKKGILIYLGICSILFFVVIGLLIPIPKGGLTEEDLKLGMRQLVALFPFMVQMFVHWVIWSQDMDQKTLANTVSMGYGRSTILIGKYLAVMVQSVILYVLFFFGYWLTYMLRPGLAPEISKTMIGLIPYFGSFLFVSFMIESVYLLISVLFRSGVAFITLTVLLFANIFSQIVLLLGLIWKPFTKILPYLPSQVSATVTDRVLHEQFIFGNAEVTTAFFLYLVLGFVISLVLFSKQDIRS